MRTTYNLLVFCRPHRSLRASCTVSSRITGCVEPGTVRLLNVVFLHSAVDEADGIRD